MSRADSKDNQIIYLGTPTDEDCLLCKLWDMPQWYKIVVPACDDDFRTTDENLFSQRHIDEKVSMYTQAGMMHVFMREYMMKRDVAVGRPFADIQFRYYDPREEQFPSRQGLPTVIMIDPAKTIGVTACDTAIIGVTFDPTIPAIYIRDVLAGHFDQTQTLDEMISMARQLRATAIAAETAGLGEHIRQPIMNAITTSGQFYQFIDLKPRAGKGEFSGPGGGKIARIWSLVPYYRQGIIYHNAACCLPLENQLRPFPATNVKRDIADVLGYIAQVQEALGLSFVHCLTTEMDPPEYDEMFAEMELRCEPELDPVSLRDIAAIAGGIKVPW